VSTSDAPGEAGVQVGLASLRPSQGTLVRFAVIGAALAFVLAGLPPLLSLYWINVMTAVAIYTIVALGLNLLVGRVGLVSLGQVAILALGAWIAARLDFATSLPFPLVLLATGVLTAILGVLVGLPALRVSGLYLALITLMLAGAITIVLNSTNFPNGGGGFLGHTESSFGSNGIRRPSIATSDPAYYRYAVLVSAVMFLLALVHVRSKPGRAWAAIRQSEPAALAAGVNVTVYKLWAFALAAFMTGTAGGILGGSSGKLFVTQFTTQSSIYLLAVVLMGGIFSIWGAVVAAILLQLLPALLDNWGAPPDLLTVIFGVGVLQVLATAPEGLVVQVPRDLTKLGRLLLRLGRGLR
jgi:branched-chain amino acid transport system permease protein